MQAKASLPAWPHAHAWACCACICGDHRRCVSGSGVLTLEWVELSWVNPGRLLDIMFCSKVPHEFNLRRRAHPVPRSGHGVDASLGDAVVVFIGLHSLGQRYDGAPRSLPHSVADSRPRPADPFSLWAHGIFPAGATGYFFPSSSFNPSSSRELAPTFVLYLDSGCTAGGSIQILCP